jgi:hypothetical protein
MLRLHLRKVPMSGKKSPLVLHPALSQSSNKDVRQVDLFQVHGVPLPHITTGGFMLRLHLRKVPVEYEIGFLKKKLGSTRIRENR